MREIYQPRDNLVFEADTPMELYDQLREYYDIDLTGINRTVTLRTGAWIEPRYSSESNHLKREQDGRLITARLSYPSKLLSHMVLPEGPYTRTKWMPVIELETEENTLQLNPPGILVPVEALIPEPDTQKYQATIEESDKFPLEMEPNSAALVGVLEQLLPYYEESDYKNGLMWGALAEAITTRVPREEFKERLEQIDNNIPEPAWSEVDLAYELQGPMLERDVALLHLRSPNTLQAYLLQHQAEYNALMKNYQSTYAPDPKYGGKIFVLKQDPESVKVREGVMDRWQALVVDVATRNGWTAYAPNNPTERDELFVNVTNGDSTVIVNPALFRWTGGSAVAHGSRYGIKESHLRKWVSMYEGVQTDHNPEPWLLTIEKGYFTSLKRVPTIEELDFFEKVLAAYY